MNDIDKIFLTEQFKEFKAPPGFKHGKVRTRLEGCCARIVSDGKGGGILKGRSYDNQCWHNCIKGKCDTEADI